MNILFLLSCLEPAGSETYCVTLAKAWQGKHRIFWISDRLHYGQKYLSLPISRKAIPYGFINALKIAGFIRKNKIDLIHSHSRRAHWAAAQAAWITGIPHVATIHQPPPVHFFSKLWPCLGDATIAIDEMVEAHLLRYFAKGIRKLVLIRNGIFIEPPPPLWGRTEVGGTPHPNLPPQGGKENRVVLLGRLSGGRRETARFLLTTLKHCAAVLPKVHFQIAGHVPEEHRQEWTRLLRETNAAIAPSTVELAGFQNDLPAFLNGAAGVIAAGRSAMESLAFGIPVIALGEGGIAGLVMPETLKACLASNFGDHMVPKHFDPVALEKALRELLAGSMPVQPAWCREQMKKYFDVEVVSLALEDVYRSLIN